MNTTKLIELLKSVEFGASGRPREISFSIPFTIDEHAEHEPGDDIYLSSPTIQIESTGDGIAGAELTLRLE